MTMRGIWTGSAAIIALIIMAGATPARATTTLLADNFNDNSIDGAKWTVVTAGIPQNPKSVTEQNMRIELEGRAHFNTVAQFDPLLAPEQGIRIRGQWTFVNNDDFMQIELRSDGVPSGGFGETANGIEFQVSAAGIGGNMTIINRGGTTVTGLSNNGVLNPAAGETYDFEIRDTGSNLYFTMSQVGGTKQRTVVATSLTDRPTDFISFHNRESGRRSNLDNVIIDSPTILGRAPTIPLRLDDSCYDNSLDPNKWNVVTAGVPNGGGSVTEVNSRIQLVGRAHLVTKDEFDPTDGGLRVEGRWTFGSDDFMQILTRSDGLPAGAFGETFNGIEFFAFDGNDSMAITRRINGATTSLGSTGIDIAPGDVFDFLITDDGKNLTFTLTQVGGDGTTGQLVAMDNTSYAANFVAFHNRENGRTAFLDDIAITGFAIPEPATAMMSLLGLAGLCLRGRRRSAA